MVDLTAIFNELNEEYFAAKLKIDRIMVIPSMKYWSVPQGKSFSGLRACYDATRNIIAFNPDILDDKEGLRKTMYHEMCHILVKGHGVLFQKLLNNYKIT